MAMCTPTRAPGTATPRPPTSITPVHPSDAGGAPVLSTSTSMAGSCTAPSRTDRRLQPGLSYSYTQLVEILVSSFYSYHNPKLSARVPAFLHKFRGRETDLFYRLARKYGEHPFEFWPEISAKLEGAFDRSPETIESCCESEFELDETATDGELVTATDGELVSRDESYELENTGIGKLPGRKHFNSSSPSGKVQVNSVNQRPRMQTSHHHQPRPPIDPKCKKTQSTQVAEQISNIKHQSCARLAVVLDLDETLVHSFLDNNGRFELEQGPCAGVDCFKLQVEDENFVVVRCPLTFYFFLVRNVVPNDLKKIFFHSIC